MVFWTLVKIALGQHCFFSKSINKINSNAITNHLCLPITNSWDLREYSAIPEKPVIFQVKLLLLGFIIVIHSPLPLEVTTKTSSPKMHESSTRNPFDGALKVWKDISLSKPDSFFAWWKRLSWCVVASILIHTII